MMLFDGRISCQAPWRVGDSSVWRFGLLLREGRIYEIYSSEGKGFMEFTKRIIRWQVTMYGRFKASCKLTERR